MIAILSNKKYTPMFHNSAATTASGVSSKKLLVSLTPPLRERLERSAADQDMNMSSFIRDAIKFYCNHIDIENAKMANLRAGGAADSAFIPQQGTVLTIMPAEEPIIDDDKCSSRGRALAAWLNEQLATAGCK